MYRGDRARKETLVEYGFRLPERARQPAAQVRGVRGARPAGASTCRRRRASTSSQKAQGVVVEQVIRPTGLHGPRGRGAPGLGAGRRPARRDQGPRAKKNERVLVHHAHQAHGGGPDRLLPRARRAHPLPALGHRHARAHRHPARPAPRRVRRARRHQPPPRGARPARGLARRHLRRRQGGLPAEPALAHPDDRARRAQRERPRHHVRRPR